MHIKHVTNVTNVIAFIYVFLDKPIHKIPSASFWFSAVFRFKNLTQEIFLELHGTKTPDLILPSHTRTPKERRRGAVEPPHHLAARVPPGAPASGVGAHRAPPGSGLRPYKPVPPKTLSTRSLFHEKFHRCHRHQP